MNLPHNLTVEQLEAELAKRSLMNFIPYATPGFIKPLHLKPIIDAIEATKDGNTRLVVSVSVQHGKTESLLAALVHKLIVNPDSRNAYISYSDSRGHEISRQTQWMCDRIGFPYEGTLDLWGPPRRGSIRWTGIGGGLTGAPIDGLMVVDDPVKNREEAESPTVRDNIDSWFKSVAMTRIHPSSSIVVVQSRWHEDDLAGRLIKRGWDHINIPAIDPVTNTALWEDRRPLSWLLEQRKQLGEYDWASLYMGEPYAINTKLFKEATRSSDPRQDPKAQVRIAIGVDLAYSAKSSADWSTAVVVAEHDGKWHILEVVRKQEEADQFAKRLYDLSIRYPGAPMRWDASTTEIGTAAILKSFVKIPLSAVLAKGDPKTRSLKVAAAWNQGKVTIPHDGEWIADFTEELRVFSGIKDPNDDQAAALASAFELLPARPVQVLPAYMSPEWIQSEEQKLMEASIAKVKAANRLKDKIERRHGGYR